jgi:hypothetical protein
MRTLIPAALSLTVCPAVCASMLHVSSLSRAMWAVRYRITRGALRVTSKMSCCQRNGVFFVFPPLAADVRQSRVFLLDSQVVAANPVCSSREDALVALYRLRSTLPSRMLLLR